MVGRKSDVFSGSGLKVWYNIHMGIHKAKRLAGQAARIWKCSRCGACCMVAGCKDLGKDNLCKVYNARPAICRVPMAARRYRQQEIEAACDSMRTWLADNNNEPRPLTSRVLQIAR